MNNLKSGHVDFTAYVCNRCDWEMPEDLSNEEAYQKAIDHIFGHSFITDYFSISVEKAKKLKNFFYANGYISYEFHPEVVQILKDLDKFLEEK